MTVQPVLSTSLSQPLFFNSSIKAASKVASLVNAELLVVLLILFIIYLFGFVLTLQCWCLSIQDGTLNSRRVDKCSASTSSASEQHQPVGGCALLIHPTTHHSQLIRSIQGITLVVIARINAFHIDFGIINFVA